MAVKMQDLTGQRVDEDSLRRCVPSTTWSISRSACCERGDLRLVLTLLGTLLAVAYPVAVYLGLSRFSVRALSLLLLCLLLPMVALRLRGQRREYLTAILPVPISVIALIALSAILEDGVSCWHCRC